MKLLATLIFVFCLTVQTQIAQAEIPEDVRHEVNQRVQHQLNPSIVLGLYENGQFEFYTQGSQHKEEPAQVSTNSVYEIGSITKTFTALLLAQLVVEQKIKLDDTIESYWPKPFSLKDSGGQAITFEQLSTHSSGLPRLPNNINLFNNDPYASYDQALMLSAIEKTQISQAGVNYAYSNFAVGVLGETLAQITGQSFNDLLTLKIIKPLNLSHTYTQLNQVPENILVQGYEGNSAATAWNFKALAGAGSIRSSIKDLLAYGVAFLKPPNQAMHQAMQLTLQTHYQQGDLKVGLGWHNNNGIWWHNGGTGGFRSIIMIDQKNQKVAAGITNDNHNDVEDLVAHLIDPTKAMRQNDYPVAIDAAQLSQFTGAFLQPETNKKITIVEDNNQLFFTANNQPKQALIYIGDDTFKFKMIQVKIKYIKDPSGQITTLSLVGWGEPQTYDKQAVN